MVLFFILFSCSETDLDDPMVVRETIDECLDNSFGSVSEIEENLTGNWKLVANGCGHCIDPDFDAQSFITFFENDGNLIYHDDYIDTTFQFEWWVTENVGIETNNRFKLETDPEFYVLNLSFFCEEYMGQDQRPVDGVMYLYQKQ